jgi:subtilisin family serine protease
MPGRRYRKSDPPLSRLTGSRPLQVMVELGVIEDASPDEILRTASELSVAGFELDRRYGAVRIATLKEHVERLRAERRRAVIVRGSVGPERLRELEAQPWVLRVWTDSVVEPFVVRRAKRRKSARPAPAPDCSNGSSPTGDIADVRARLGVDKIWAAGGKGEGIVVGMVDGGICAKGRTTPPHSCGVAIDRVVDGWPAADWGTTAEHWDGHGNMTAFDVLGIAPKAHLYDIRIVNVDTGNPAKDFRAWVSDAVQAYEWAITRHQTDGTPHILSNSWGLYKRNSDRSYAEDPESPFARQVEAALAEGILVVFAAGNCGAACPFPKCGTASVGPGKSILGPNGHPEVMTVGAVNLARRLVGYSSQGPAVLPPNAPKPDFCAMTQFEGYFPTSNPMSPSDGGTSAAAAVAAGVVALLKEKKPALTQADARLALVNTAADLSPAGTDSSTGAGLIRAKKAYDAI